MSQLHLEPGRVYRTRDLATWSANPPRLAKRLVDQGELVPLAHGLFARPKQSRFGPVPPLDEEIMRAFLDGGAFVFTGPERWNALGLGTTACSPCRSSTIQSVRARSRSATGASCSGASRSPRTRPPSGSSSTCSSTPTKPPRRLTRSRRCSPARSPGVGSVATACARWRSATAPAPPTRSSRALSERAHRELRPRERRGVRRPRSDRLRRGTALTGPVKASSDAADPTEIRCFKP